MKGHDGGVSRASQMHCHKSSINLVSSVLPGNREIMPDLSDGGTESSHVVIFRISVS